MGYAGFPRNPPAAESYVKNVSSAVRSGYPPDPYSVWAKVFQYPFSG
jgi:hypothetical protein